MSSDFSTHQRILHLIYNRPKSHLESKFKDQFHFLVHQEIDNNLAGKFQYLIEPSAQQNYERKHQSVLIVGYFTFQIPQVELAVLDFYLKRHLSHCLCNCSPKEDEVLFENIKRQVQLLRYKLLLMYFFIFLTRLL